ncbi:putative organic cation transporter protein-like [Apostichopus japonicus]|uniref:Putative organic cation transporter protein-like n=1 Tax=Stichopus japonicus TaxID=307972 RepID=A0A2G8K0U5_STIJA|nr:putative organic cation transporter protein-like [Apostichopus japonicus]
MDFDDILEIVGDFGPYQITLLTLVCLTATPQAMNSLSGVFILGDLNHWCSVQEWSDDVTSCYDLLSISKDDYLECIHRYRASSIPSSIEDGDIVYSECDKYDAVYPNDWSQGYYAGNYTRLLLLAMKDGFTTRANTWHLLLVTIGRYYTFFISCGLHIVFTFLTAFTRNYWMLTLLRFLTGTVNISMYIMAFILGTELVGPSKRVFAGILICLTYAVGYLLLAVAAFFIRDWRYLQIFLACILLPCLLLIPVLPESARWLISKKKFKGAIKIVDKIAKKNKTSDKVPPNLEDEMTKEQEASSNAKMVSAIDIFRTPGLRLHALNMMFNWTINNLVYVGLTFNTADLGGNDYVSFFLSGLVEIPAYLLCIPLIGSFLGRKWSTSMLEIIGGVACICTILIPTGVWKTTVAMIGKFCISASFAIIYIYAAEIFPTVARSAGIGLCSTSGRIGSILGPLILALGEVIEFLPLLIFGLSAIVGGLLVIFLPETKGAKLPETLADCSPGVKRGKEEDMKLTRSQQTNSHLMLNLERRR